MDYNLEEIENVLHHLNYRWNLEALAQWKGDKVPFEPYLLYEGYEDFISLETLRHIDRLDNGINRNRLRHALIDHFLQRELLPHETETRAWMRGASARVEDQKVYFRDIIPWCQKESTYDQRQILQDEVTPLCKFLKPFALNYWNELLGTLERDFGYASYLDYCGEKKEIDYGRFYTMVREILHETDALYFPAMEDWAGRSYGLPLDSLTRYDAINLLGMSQFDDILPDGILGETLSFLNHLGIYLDEMSGLHLEMGNEKGKSAQAMCFILQIPEEIYILIKPQGGWSDLEALWHELGHGLSAALTSSGLTIVEKDMATSHSLSEAFAFLLQNISTSRPFLDEFFELDKRDYDDFYYHKVLRDLSVFRRYSAKFLVEFEMFSKGVLHDGGSYADMMKRFTGFYYQPESHLFDLAPEFYCLDYLFGWMAEAVLEDLLKQVFGERWMSRPEAGDILKKWWKQGNSQDIFAFMEGCGAGPLGPEQLLEKWRRVLG